MAAPLSVVTPLVTPIVFPCVVLGKKLTATITHTEDNYIQPVFHISFSDGYKAVMIATELDAPDGWWDNNVKGSNSSYARAIEQDLDALVLWQPGEAVCLITVDFENENDVNIWAVQDMENENLYSVSWNGDYRFTAERTKERWKFYSVRVLHPEPINEGLAVYIGKQIDAQRSITA